MGAAGKNRSAGGAGITEKTRFAHQPDRGTPAAVHRPAHRSEHHAGGSSCPRVADEARSARPDEGCICSTCSLSERGDASEERALGRDRKSTRLNSSHGSISYAVFCLKK